MKLGVAGLLGDASPQAARQVREMGFSATSWHLPEAALLEDFAHLDAVRENLDSEEIELCQLLPPPHPSLVDRDRDVRQLGIRMLRKVIDAAHRVGAGNVYIRPGSLNPAGPWTPHPENHRAETRGRLIESLRDLVPHAEALGMPLAVEAHVLSPLYTPAIVREVLDAVASPVLKFNADPVNLIGSLEQAFDSMPLLDEIFEQLRDRIVCAHAKDVTVQNRLVLHLEECVPGQGFLDHECFLRRFEAACPRGVVLIEHLPPERVPEARRALLEFAARAGLQFEGG